MGNPENSITKNVNEFNQVVKGTSLTQDAIKRLKKNKMAVTGLWVIVAYIIVSISAPILPIYSYRKQIIEHQYLPPSFRPAGELLLEKEETYMWKVAKKLGKDTLSESDIAKLDDIKRRIKTETQIIDGEEVLIHQRVYLLGTDDLGRDMLSRIIYGGQISIAVGIIATIISILIGMFFGSIAGYAGGRTDYIIMRVVDVMYGLPYMFLVIIFQSLFGGSIINFFIALAVVSWLTTARVVRGQVMSLKNSVFVEAARSMGASSARIIAKHLLPNSLGIIIVYATLQVPSFIMMESFLSFLGLGISAPYASWGSLIKDGIDGMTLYPWRLFFPALAMTIFLFAMNFFGDGLRDAFDPQSKNK
ncbi:ABC transporter permease [Thiospirochaeta perfilievii]|uniref:Oligopeptide transport system permease protein OppC n=1 Tax=Thiospirochaeta perfilievii TaxID=252967 RepID=A0A5C1QI29_9SPIO|nr:ABC transporter permease [Thiospirochaeta perfilievii]QEN06194.1 ABC transporter permease [Thiospirochaeta perfilievii]